MEKLGGFYEKANSKVNINFEEGLDNLKKEEEIEINIRLENKQWKTYDQEKNYSFESGITAEYDGMLIQGEFPKEVNPVEEIIKVDAQMYNK